MNLSPEGLSTLKNVKVPTYDPKKLTPGIVHIGVGNFHRSHMATYMNDLFNSGFDHDWGIIGSSVMQFDDPKRDAMQKQSWMSTIATRDADTVSAQVIASMVDYIPIDQKTNAPLKEALLDPRIRIVSMTITEGGYFLGPDGKFNPQDPRIVKDAQNSDSPETVVGAIVQALKKRKDAGIAPFTVMSCDNVPHNGDVAKDAVVGLATILDKDFGAWIQDNVGFPNSMVDRITPATTPAEVKFVRDRYGYEDSCCVFSEPFRQWVLQDQFLQGRPALEKVGVQFVSDVAPYERMKIRILNGGHASLSYAGSLLDLKFVHQAMEHPVLSAYLDKLERTEIIPGVPPVPDTSLTEYWELIGKRFSNPTINDQLQRNCFDGPNRQPKFVIAQAADALAAGRPVDGFALASAFWCRYCQGKTDSGAVIPPNDPIWDRLHETALKAASDPSVWTGMKDIYGDVGANPIFAESFAKALKMVSDNGVEAAMKSYVEATA